VKTTHRKILVVTIVILAAAILTTPVMAIGPFKALDVGNNNNLGSSGPGVMNHRGGEGGGLIYWMMGTSGEHWVKWEFQDAASQAKGIMNNAIIAGYSGAQNGLMPYFMSLGENENKWIYLSGDGDYPGQYTSFLLGTHGMLWWFMFGITYVATYPVVYAATIGTPQEKAAAANLAATNAGVAAANADIAEHTAGCFWKTNEIKGSLP
jgi:hypothetical protein